MLYKMREEEFATVYKIMSESFPVDERRTFDEQIGLLTNPLFEILVWKDGDLGDVKGFISTYRLEGFCFVEHFAVSEKYRNEGIGRSVLKNCLKGRKSLSGSRAAGNGTGKAPDRILSQKRFLYERISVYTTAYFQGYETPSAYNNDYRRRN